MHTPLDAWVHGWAICRNTPTPVAFRGGYRIDVGQPGHNVRYVLPMYYPELTGGKHQPDTWLKVCGTVALDPPWQVQPPEYLMTTELAETAVRVGGSYRLDTAVESSLIQVVVRAGDDSVAARGKAGLAGGCAVFDQIETDPQHRRRGLGRAVMGALSTAAQYAGATTGVLVATEDGRALYSALGWTLSSPMTAAVSQG
ncbi:GNAT family N-acetyltransferase [Kribbella sp. NPDC050820]|uniref:GNAT family N-acetyltransferase n=1 Tax=Kribbella sp. NPDC050820 TaxID=3155408 RepID=UPI0033FD9FC6